MKRLILRAEYATSALWALWIGIGATVEADSPPLSEHTVVLIREYAAEYNQTMEIGFASESVYKAYVKKGAEIWRRMRIELGNEYSVLFLVPNTGNYLKVDDEGVEVLVSPSELSKIFADAPVSEKFKRRKVVDGGSEA